MYSHTDRYFRTQISLTTSECMLTNARARARYAINSKENREYRSYKHYLSVSYAIICEQIGYTNCIYTSE